MKRDRRLEARTPERSDGREAEPVDAFRLVQFEAVFSQPMKSAMKREMASLEHVDAADLRYQFAINAGAHDQCVS